MKKTSFGKIQLTVRKDEKKSIDSDEELNVASVSGFGTFGEINSASTNTFDDKIEEMVEDQESQHVKEIMGFSEFGKKAKSFAIDEQIAKALATAPKHVAMTDNTPTDNNIIKPNDGESNDDNDETIGPFHPAAKSATATKTSDTTQTKREDNKNDSCENVGVDECMDEPQLRRIPATHESKAIQASAGSTGARLTFGSIDYDSLYWTAGAWHPYRIDEFITSALDGTVHYWTTIASDQYKSLTRAHGSDCRRAVPNSCTYNRDALIATGCGDGSIQTWDTRTLFVNTTSAHQTGNDISSMAFSYSRNHLLSRSMDEIVTLWDPSRHATTDSCFSPFVACQSLHAIISKIKNQFVAMKRTEANDLIDDVLCEVFAHMNFKDLWQVADVCWSFRSVAQKEIARRNEPIHFIREKGENGTGTIVLEQKWFSVIRRLGPGLTSVVVCGGSNMLLKRLFSECDAIQSLVLIMVDATYLNSPVMLPHIKSIKIEEMDITTEFIQHLQPSFEILEKLELRKFKIVPDMNISRVISRCIQLKELELSCKDKVFMDSPVELPLKTLKLDIPNTPAAIAFLLSELEAIELQNRHSNQMMGIVKKFAPNIKSLKWKVGKTFDDWNSFTNLKSLDIELSDVALISTLTSVADATFALENLRICIMDWKISAQSVIAVVTEFKKLKNLELAFVYGMTFSHLLEVVRNLPALSTLQVAWMRFAVFSLHEIPDIIESRPELESLSYGEEQVKCFDNDAFKRIIDAVNKHSKSRPFHLNFLSTSRIKMSVSRRMLKENSDILQINFM